MRRAHRSLSGHEQRRKRAIEGRLHASLEPRREPQTMAFTALPAPVRAQAHMPHVAQSGSVGLTETDATDTLKLSLKRTRAHNTKHNCRRAVYAQVQFCACIHGPVYVHKMGGPSTALTRYPPDAVRQRRGSTAE